MPAAKLRRSLLPIPSSAALAAKREDAKLKGTAGGPPKSDAPIDIVATVQKENGKTSLVSSGAFSTDEAVHRNRAPMEDWRAWVLAADGPVAQDAFGVGGMPAASACDACPHAP